MERLLEPISIFSNEANSGEEKIIITYWRSRGGDSYCQKESTYTGDYTTDFQNLFNTETVIGRRSDYGDPSIKTIEELALELTKSRAIRVEIEDELQAIFEEQNPNLRVLEF